MQEPLIRVVPDYVRSQGRDAVDLAAMAGLVLDPWQASELTDAMGERADGKWAARDAVQVVCRQNGKGATLQARQLAGLFLLGEELQVHTAHEFKTCAEHFRRVMLLVENTDALRKRCKKPRTANGEQQIETLKGQRLRFLARSGNSGRGFSCDTLYYDEAFNLPEETIQASGPSQSARANPQTWYASSAVDQEQHENGLVLARLRALALAKAPGIAYFEHAADLDIRTATDEEVADVANWAAANPGLGRRVTIEELQRGRKIYSRRAFLIEHLGVGDWPDPDATDSPITPEQWAQVGDLGMARPSAPVMFAVDATPLSTRASIVVCGDGAQVELVENAPGTGWVVARCKELQARYNPLGFVVDPRSPAGALLNDLHEAGIEPITPTTVEATQACGMFLTAVKDATLTHRHDRELDAAVKGAALRPVGDAAMWARRGATTDISPLVAATLALWGWSTRRSESRLAINNVW